MFLKKNTKCFLQGTREKKHRVTWFPTFSRGSLQSQCNNASIPVSGSRNMSACASCSEEFRIQKIVRISCNACRIKSRMDLWITQIKAWCWQLPAVFWSIIWRSLFDPFHSFHQSPHPLPFRHFQLLVSFNHWHNRLLLFSIQRFSFARWTPSGLQPFIKTQAKNFTFLTVLRSRRKFIFHLIGKMVFMGLTPKAQKAETIFVEIFCVLLRKV